MRLGAEGIRVQVGGRLAALKSHVPVGREGRVPAHCVRISITRLLKPQPLTASSVSKFGSSKAKYWAAFKPFAIRLAAQRRDMRRKPQGDKREMLLPAYEIPQSAEGP